MAPGTAGNAPRIARPFQIDAPGCITACAQTGQEPFVILINYGMNDSPHRSDPDDGRVSIIGLGVDAARALTVNGLWGGCTRARGPMRRSEPGSRHISLRRCCEKRTANRRKGDHKRLGAPPSSSACPSCYTLPVPCRGPSFVFCGKTTEGSEPWHGTLSPVRAAFQVTLLISVSASHLAFSAHLCQHFRYGKAPSCNASSCRFCADAAIHGSYLRSTSG